MSYSNSFPTQRPTLNLDFANSGKLDSRISYIRSSTGTALSSERHLSSENLLLQSQDFDTSWVPSSIAAPTGSQTAPDGTSTGWLFSVNSGATVRAGVYQDWTASANTEYTLIAHLKAGTASHGYASMRTNSGDYYAGALLDFSAGTISVTSAGMTSATGTVTELSSNWFRVTVTATSGTSLTSPQITIGVSDGTAVGTNGRPAWTAAGTETMYAWGAQLSTTNSKVYDSPTTTQIHREYAPTLKTSAADEPRFEYTANGESEGLLIESSATNLQRYGSDFASWADKSYTTVTSNSGIAPNGLLEADLAVPNSQSQLHYIFDTAAVIASGTTYTGSVYVKKAGHRYIQMTASTTNFGSNQWATFDLADGSIDANNVTASAVSVGNGWWRIQTTMTSIAAGTGGMAIQFANTATSARFPTISGNDFDGVLLWGFQLETGSSASSLVDTGSLNSTISRASDSCSVATADFGYTGGDFSLVFETPAGAGQGNHPMLFEMGVAGTTVNRFQVYKNTSIADASDSWYAHQNSDGFGYVTGSAGSSRVAISYASNDLAIDTDTGTLFTDTSRIVPLVDQIAIGSNDTFSSNQLNGHIKRVALYNVALSDTALQALTS